MELIIRPTVSSFYDFSNRLSFSINTTFFSWNGNQHQVIFFGLQLAQGKQLRTAYMISRPYGYPDFLSRFKFFLGNNSLFLLPRPFERLGIRCTQKVLLAPRWVFTSLLLTYLFFFSIEAFPEGGNPAILGKILFSPPFQIPSSRSSQSVK